MRITGISARPLYAELCAPMRSRGDVGYSEYHHTGSEYQRVTVVEVYTDTADRGITLLPGDARAWIDTVAVPALRDRDYRAIRHCREAVVRTLQAAPEGHWRVSRGYLNRLEFALWDLLAKDAGMPLYRLLGGTDPHVQVYAGGGTLCWNPLPLLLRETEALLERGFRAFKIKIGHGPQEDSEMIRSLRRAAGPEVRILVDANRAYDLEGARQLCPVLEEEEIGWFEEPLPYENPGEWRALRESTTVPLAGGEGFRRLHQAAEALRHEMLQVLQCDAGGFGLEGLLAIGSLAAEAGAALTPHCCNNGIGFVVAAHLQRALPNAEAQEFETFDNPFVQQLFQDFPRLHGGCVRLPDAAGLGLTLDEEVIARHLQAD